MNVLSAFARFAGLTRLSFKRLFSQLGLAAALSLGVAVAVMLAAAIPMFSNAVQLRVLQQRIENAEQNQRLPPFAFVVAYYGSISGQVDYEDYLKDDAFVSQRLPAAIGLPITQTVKYVHTNKFRLFPADKASQYADANTQLEWMSIGMLPGIEDKIQVFGELPQKRDDGVIEALAYVETANTIGVQAGEDYILYGPSVRGEEPIQQKVHITGIWAEKDPEDTFWFYRPDALGDNLLVTPETYVTQVAPNIKQDVELGLWYFLADGSRLDTEAVLPMLGRLSRLSTELNNQRVGLGLRVSPNNALRRYITATNELTLLLTVFSVPLLAVVLYFVTMVSGMVVREQSGEIAVLRSRGASTFAIAMLYFIQMLFVGLVGLALGMVAGYGLASLMTRLTSFLTIAPNVALAVGVNNQAIRFGIAASVIALLAALLPAIAAARRNIVSYRSSQARTTRAPLWQRAFLDVLLLIAAVYVYFQLKQSGGILLATDARRAADPFSDPVRFLAPVLMLAALALLLVRFFPWVMRALAALAGRLPFGTSTLLSLRSLARAPAVYLGPLLLLIFTMGLAVFSSSIALTLDRHLTDSLYFRIGADMRLVEMGDPSKVSTPFSMQGGSDSNVTATEDTAAPEEEEPLYYTFVPVSEHLRIPGVKAAARVGEYMVQPQARNVAEKNALIGVDRVDFQQTAYFRDDFSPQPLGSLMNTLASNPSALLVQRNFLAQNNLRIGEPLVLNVNAGALPSHPISFTIAGTFDMFPHANPEEQRDLFVGNLDYIFENLGTAVQYDVLLAVAPDTDLNKIVDQAGSLGFLVVNGDDTGAAIREAQVQPERRGLFGLLSAGFIAASLLTMVGFVLSAVITFRSRRIQLGMLRTVGLSAWQMGFFIALEQVLLIGLGALAGSLLGVLVSQLFIPFMQVGGSLANTIPPFVVRIAWRDLLLIYASLALALLVALVIMLASLRRLKAFEAIKLGAV